VGAPGSRASKSGREAALGFLAVAGLALAGCGSPPPRNVVLVLVDTLRADHVGAYGYGRPTTPNFDAFAAQGVLFERAWSQAACTFPSVNSLLTSRYPARFLGQPGEAMGIPAGELALPEILAQAGFATAAVSASPIVRVSPTRFNPGGGFGRGFDHFDEQCLWRDAGCVTARARKLLRQLEPPFFLYLHYMDPHGPYQPPAGTERHFAQQCSGPDFICRGDPNPIARMLYSGGTEVEAGPAAIASLVDLYDEEIRHWDASFGELLAALEEQGLTETTAVAVASDHGEEFLEHGHVKHCRTLFDTEARVPLALRAPWLSGGRRAAAPVQNLDLAPTLLEALAMASGQRGFEGRSLVPLMRGGAARPRHVFAAQGPLRSVTDGRLKLIHDLRAGRFWLYDREADRGETRDLLAAAPPGLRLLRRELSSWLSGVEGEPSRTLDAADEMEKRLRSLGYLQ
jgi:arylsulfatase A-like enzyme